MLRLSLYTGRSVKFVNEKEDVSVGMKINKVSGNKLTATVNGLKVITPESLMFRFFVGTDVVTVHVIECRLQGGPRPQVRVGIDAPRSVVIERQDATSKERKPHL